MTRQSGRALHKLLRVAALAALTFAFLQAVPRGQGGGANRALPAARESTAAAQPPKSPGAAARSAVPRAFAENDPLLAQEWHLKARAEEPAGANVRAAWPTVLGSGVVIGITDDGLERTHPDLLPNYSAALSFDFNNNDADPSPSAADAHGTSVAGVAAARGGNAIGVSGAAPLATLAGLRLTSAGTTDAQEAAAFNFQNQDIHISSNSWGPPDNGLNLTAPGPLAQAAMEAAATTGRSGRGRIFVWAAGNGRDKIGGGDNCNYDGYANSRFVIAVGAVGDNAVFAPYSEPCAAMLVTSPSQGAPGTRAITTTDLPGANGYAAGDYNSVFNGTSAATPIVSGIVALMLQRNPNLTWRDVQHILVRSSVRINPNDPGWSAGPFPHNENYGFGLVDAQAAVNMAGTWINVPAEGAVPPVAHTVNLTIPINASGIVTPLTDVINIPAQFNNLLVEHVEVEFNATHTWRGDLDVTLTSPSGVQSHLATVHLDNNDNYTAWKFRSVRHWGETAAGNWTLRVADLYPPEDGGLWQNWTLRIYGRQLGTVTADSSTPNTGSGLTQTFTLRYGDTVGATDLSQTWAWFAASMASAANSCLSYVDRGTNTINLLNDAGTSYSSAALGSGTILQNAQCAISAAGITLTPTGNQMAVTLPVTFKGGYAGAKNIFMFGSGTAGANSGWQDRGDWTVSINNVVSAVSVTPAAGSGLTQNFSLQFSDTATASNLSTTWGWFAQSMASAASSCLTYYDRAANQLFLLNDAGTAWTSAAPGAAATLQNSQCAISAATSAIVIAGNTLTMNLAMTFKPAYAGVKNIFMYAASPGTNSGWQDLGDWTVPVTTTTVTAVSSTPNAGSGIGQSFVLRYDDTAGVTDLSTTWAWFTTTMASAANSCMTYYDRAANRLNLLNDAGTAWMSAVIGSAGTLANNQCFILMPQISVAVSGNSLMVTLAMNFKPGYAGAKNIFMYAANASGINSGWQDRGDWTVPGIVLGVTADSVTPNTGSGTTQTFALQYSDGLGATNLTQAWVWFTPAMGSGANSCLAYYDRPTNTIFLLNDAGSTWMSAAPGSATTLQNSQCAIAMGTSGAMASGSALTVNLPMTFKPAFAGGKNIFMFATNGTQNSGWQDRGDWTVPGTGIAVTADSATPSSGSGATQTFALQYSDTAGATDLTQAWVWFTPLFTSPAASSCMAYYQRATNQVFLLNDAGTAFTAGTLGTVGTLQNNQCAINLATSSAAAVGNSLTLNLAMTFKSPAFSGAKNVFVFATNGAQNSGWQDRGDWTVP